MSKRLKITFDPDVPQSKRFEIEQKLNSAGWMAGGQFEPSDTSTAKNMIISRPTGHLIMMPLFQIALLGVT